MQQRIEKLRHIIQTQSLDAILISSVPNIIYLTGYLGFVPDERDAYVLITKDEAYIFTNLLYAEAMGTEVPHLKLVEITRQYPFSEGLQELVAKQKIKTLGFEENNLTVREFKKLSELSVSLKNADLHTLRLQKDRSEVTSLQKACTITDQGFAHILENIKPGMTEKAVESMIERFFLEHDAQLAFRSIVAFGQNTTIPHHLSGNTTLKKNDVILIDFGAKVDSYCADVSRTFFIGKATVKQKEIYTLVANTQSYICDQIKLQLKRKKKILSNELDKKAREFIAAQNYPPFPYSLGHGIGLQVHERPLLNPNFSDEIIEDMVFTLEPGIHLTEEIGVRIEDDYCVKNNQLHQLTHAPKELIIL